MLASLLASAIVALSLLVSPSAAQTNTFSFCFTASSLPTSPYGPWSVATYGQITTTGAAFFVNDTAASGGGQRMAYGVTGASVTRKQINRDGSTSTAQLGLCPVSVQGSDNRLFQAAPWTDWNGICFAVTSSDNSPPNTASTPWIVYPNNFPTQQVELYYDLPTYNYPTEYHHDNQTNAQLTVVPGSSITCTPASMTQSLQTSVLSYQFCYQAYSASTGLNGAPWQVAIQGTLVTQNYMSRSNISGQTGFYILSVNGMRYQSVNGGASTSVPIVGQTWHNSGGGDANEFGDDPLLLQAAPHLVSGRGFVLYTNSLFTYPNGTMESQDNQYAKVNADPLSVNGATVYERSGPIPDWSRFGIRCGSSSMSCPLISNSSSAVTDYVLAADGSCPGQPSSSFATPITTGQTAALVSAVVAAAVAMLW